ncbi:MAG: metalloregulator ArsR/SmtB family transcription factor [Armatimonadota bacterium]|nr:metalloregulator ArsR/SmtB family transcription factor [Armatimonadota bacterium]MDR7518725.1 metalloregulator ArsR/SmtB family transcription factor [Armatimonadota bacterium]MDR7550019.1 metalloregulator ArsR/SmtB family transcription factor [Armatimonadota bacterium]
MRICSGPTKPHFTQEARLLRILAHPARLAILEHLRHRPACVCHLTAALEHRQAYVSQQLAILRQAGLIVNRRDGAYTSYALRDHGALGLVDLARRIPGGLPTPTLSTTGRVADCACPQCSQDARSVKGAGR